MISTETQDEYSFSFPQVMNNYKFIQKIGCGSSCMVVLVEDQTTKEKYAAKIIPKEENVQKNMFHLINNEIEILKALDHPNIIKIYDSFEIQTSNGTELVIIITEYCEKGTLLDYIINSRFTNYQMIKKILQSFLHAIKYLHDKGITHNDIKAENILLDSNFNPKLCDFGYSQTKNDQFDKSRMGTLYYAAPEKFGYGEFISLKADIYAIGILLDACIESKFPFRDGDDDYIIHQIVTGNLKIGRRIDENLRHLIVSCTELNPNKRPTIEDIIKDNYFTGNKSQNQKQNEIQMINNNSINMFDFDKYEMHVYNKLLKIKYEKKNCKKKSKKTRKSKLNKNKYRVEETFDI